MLTFRGISQFFLLPSVFLFVFLVASLLFYLLKKKKLFRFFFFLGILSYYLFSISPVSDFILFSLENEYTPLSLEEMKKADKIVLLLGGRESDVLRGSEVLRISHSMDNKLEIIISGTNPVNPKSEEALAVRNFFISRGIPAENITIEGKSKNTWENVRNVKEIVKEEEFFLVTSAYHMNRALKEFKRVNLDPIPAPADFKRKGQYNIFDIFPDPQNLKKSDLGIREHFGKIYYKFLSIREPL